MSSSILKNKDLWAGLALIAIGAGAIYIATSYPFGTSLRMGAGYFPSVLGGILIVFGLILLLRSIRSTEEIESNWSPRALVILPIAFILFGLLIDRAGFVPALFVLIFGSALAGREFKLLEVIPLALVVTLLCVAIFIWGLGLPYQLFAGPFAF